MNSYIPDNFYCSFDDFYRTSGLKGTLLVGYMTPDGTDAPAESRKKTIRAYGNKDFKPLSFANKPLNGFKFHGFKYSSTGDGYAWIIDPRGFVTVIKLSDFNELLKQVTIRNGEILKECVWVRNGRYNKLITKDSDQYQESKKTTEGLKQNYKFKDLKVNDIVTLKDKTVGRYLGSFNLFRLHREEESSVDIGQNVDQIKNIVKAAIAKSRYRCILVNCDGKDKILLYKNFTIMNIEKISDKVETLNDYEDWLNVSLTKNSIEFDFRAYGNNSNAIIGFTTKKPKTINYTITLEPINDKISFWESSSYIPIKSIFTKDNDEYYCVHKTYTYGRSNVDDVVGTKVEMILKGDELYSELSYKNRARYYSRVDGIETQKKFTSSKIKLYSTVISWDNAITKKTYKRMCI